MLLVVIPEQAKVQPDVRVSGALYYHWGRHLRANGHALSASLIYEKIHSDSSFDA